MVLGVLFSPEFVEMLDVQDARVCDKLSRFGSLTVSGFESVFTEVDVFTAFRPR